MSKKQEKRSLNVFFEGKKYTIRNFCFVITVDGQTLRISGSTIYALLSIVDGKWLAAKNPHSIWRFTRSQLETFAYLFISNLLRPVGIGKYKLTRFGRETVRAYLRAQEEHARKQDQRNKLRAKLRYALFRDLSKGALELVNVESTGSAWDSCLEISACGPKSGDLRITVPESTWDILISNGSVVVRVVTPGKPWLRLARWVLEETEAFVPFLDQNALKVFGNLKKCYEEFSKEDGP